MAHPPLVAQHETLIASLLERGDLSDPRLEAAFRAVPRHRFLPGVPLDLAYADDAVPIKRDLDGTILSSISQPSMIAAMLHQLDLRPGHNVLEIGTGTGYSAALLQHIVGNSGNVTSVELDHELAKQALDHLQAVALGSRVKVVQADGAMGYAPRATYDRILASVGVWDIPPAWVRQLKVGGILVAPLWLDSLQVSAAFRLQADGTLHSDDNIPCGFVRLRGPAAGPQVAKRIGSTPLVLVSNRIAEIDEAAFHMLVSEDAEDGFLGLRLTAADYWHGLLPYLMLTLPGDYLFALYNLLNDWPAFGIEGHGFAVVGSGSACFVPYRGEGRAYCFAGADAILALQDRIAAWMAAGKPGADQLRIRLTSRPSEGPLPGVGRVFTRPHHNVEVWLNSGA